MIRRLMVVAIVVAFFASETGCGDTKIIGDVQYDTYGLLNSDDKKNPDIAYEPIVGNIVWGSILFPTVVAPVYFFGFSLFEPVGKKPEVKGAVPR